MTTASKLIVTGWPDLNYALRAQIDEAGTQVRFMLVDGSCESVALCGTISPDGCGNLRTHAPDCLNLCGFEAIMRLHLALLRTWRVARDMLTNHAPGAAP